MYILALVFSLEIVLSDYYYFIVIVYFLYKNFHFKYGQINQHFIIYK